VARPSRSLYFYLFTARYIRDKIWIFAEKENSTIIRYTTPQPRPRPVTKQRGGRIEDWKTGLIRESSQY